MLLFDVALRRGVLRAAVGGVGIATADAVFALLAVVFSAAVAPLLASWQTAVRLACAGTLIVLAGVAVRQFALELRGPGGGTPGNDLSDAEARSWMGVFVVFLGAALAHPLTLIFFASLAVGLGNSLGTANARAAFVGGVLVASVAWHVALAGLGSIRVAPLSRGARLAVIILDCAIAVVLAALIVSQVLQG